MRLHSIVGAFAGVLIVGGTAILAAPGHTQQLGQTQPGAQTTQQPGQMTEAHVWIQNRGRNEAIPISLQEATLDTPLRVRVVNTPGVPGVDDALRARLVQQTWDYNAVTLKDNEDPVKALLAPGLAGWETTGIAFTRPGSAVLLLKRPHVP